MVVGNSMGANSVFTNDESRKAERKGYYPRLSTAPSRLMLSFIMAQGINSFLSLPVGLAAHVKSHQPVINEPSLGLHPPPNTHTHTK